MPDELRRQLLAARIAGDIATPRQENLRNLARMAARTPGYTFGLVPERTWHPDEVLAVMAERCGIVRDPAYVEGPDAIGVDLTLAALTRWRDRLAEAASQRQWVLLATGHPTGILVVHLRVAAALQAAGCPVLAPDVAGWSWPWAAGDPRRPRSIRRVLGVHVLSNGGDLLHTHAGEPMRALLAALPEAPDLVVADHGWAGAAAQAGVDTLAMADCNDPALFVAEAEGRPLVTVPLDDNVEPDLYAPLTDFLLQGWA